MVDEKDKKDNSGRNRLIMIIAGGQLQGLGQTLKSLDPDSKGTDDLAGSIAKAGGAVLVAAGAGNVKGVRAALELNIQLSQEWLDDNPA